MKQKISNILLILSLAFFFTLGMIFIVYPYATDYEFETVVKNSSIYDESIFIIFHWKTSDELQVGKPIALWAEIKNLPYAEENPPEEKIIIRFDESQINYFGNKNMPDNKISKIDYLTFQPNLKNDSLSSDKINLRFIVPTDIKIQYCDYNVKTDCTFIENIIHPAPHDLRIQIDTNRLSMAVSLVVASFSSIVVWATLRPKNNDN